MALSKKQSVKPSRNSFWKRIFIEPLLQCAAVALLGIIVFMAEGIVAVRLHTKQLLIATAAFDGTLLLSLSGFTIIRVFISRE